MRIEIGDAQITDAVVEKIEDLQLDEKLTAEHLKTIDEVTRIIIFSITGDDEDDGRTLGLLRSLQLIRQTIEVISSPPDLDERANDVPTAKF